MPISLKQLADITVDWSAPEHYRDDTRCQAMSAYDYRYMSTGRHRITYLSPDHKHVIKFPRKPQGLEANIDEHMLWHKYKNNPSDEHGGIMFAPCRLVYGSLLIMKAVTAIYGSSFADDDAREDGAIGGNCSLPTDAPRWSRRLDCHQIGPLPNGKWVAYDYGGWMSLKDIVL